MSVELFDRAYYHRMLATVHEELNLLEQLAKNDTSAALDIKSYVSNSNLSFVLGFALKDRIESKDKEELNAKIEMLNTHYNDNILNLIR